METVEAESRIVVRVLQNDRPVIKAFAGRWIIGNAEAGDKFEWESGALVSHPRGYEGNSVAVTAQKRLAVLTFVDDDAELTVYDNFEELSRARVDAGYPAHPESLIQAIASELGVDYVEDIAI